MPDQATAPIENAVALHWRTDIENAPRNRKDVFIALKPKRPGSSRRHDYAVAFWAGERGWLGIAGNPLPDCDIAFWADIPSPHGGAA